VTSGSVGLIIRAEATCSGKVAVRAEALTVIAKGTILRAESEAPIAGGKRVSRCERIAKATLIIEATAALITETSKATAALVTETSKATAALSTETEALITEATLAASGERITETTLAARGERITQS
jgi:hypothetical protein